MEDKNSNFKAYAAPQMEDQISIDLDKEIVELSTHSPDYCIFRVHDELRYINSKAYEPTVIAIGPYHNGNVKLQMMEEQKLRYLKLLLQRKGMSINDLVTPIKLLEGKARKCYAEPISLDPEKLTRMMILDGCFLIELVYKVHIPCLREENDPIFQYDWILYNVERDLMLFENQLPFFVILKIFDIINKRGDKLHEFYNHLVNFFKFSFPVCSRYSDFSKENVPEIKHLLELIYTCWLGPTPKMKSKCPLKSFIRCATKLKESDIKFKKIDGCPILGIKFSEGLFEIPQLRIEDRTESFLRNMVAYEQYRRCNGYNLITSYVILMDCLIDTSKDVELLRERGIIENWQGDDERVAANFNKMTDNVWMSLDCFYYGEIFMNVNAHCEKPYNKRIASLRHKYFYSPWAFISVLAATVLLIFAITQTFFTIFPRLTYM